MFQLAYNYVLCFDALGPFPEVARVNIRQQMKNEANEMWEQNRPKSNRRDLEKKMTW